MVRFNSAKCLLLLAAVLLPGATFAQAVPWPLDEPLLPSSTGQSAMGETPRPPENVSPQAASATAPSAVTLPAGTRVMMVLKSPLHTTSGTAGSGIYLETLYPVIQGNQVVIPARTQVQGVVEANRRPGHVDRASEFRFRFTDLIFAGNYVAPIQGVLQSIPGARNIRTRDKEGTVKPVDQAEKIITPTAVGA